MCRASKWLWLALAWPALGQQAFTWTDLGDGRVELWQALQTGQLIDDKPDRFLVRHRLIQEAQNQCVDP